MAIFQQLALPVLRSLDPEQAHGLTVKALQWGLGPRSRYQDPPELGMEVLGLTFPNPVGLAAGFDKNGEVPDAMLSAGFGFVEVGTVTPLPQPGNPRPRLFRLSEDQAVINRMGFNNAGLDAMERTLAARQGRPGLVGANLGANKDSTDRIGDYVTGLVRLISLADYFTINISSPNTPGLRGLQDRRALEELLERLVEARMIATPAGQGAKPILLKVAPDLDRQAREEIAAVVLSYPIDGMIVSNTTIGLRDQLTSPHAEEDGGLSGAPLRDLSTKVLRDFYQLTNGQLTLIGVGGISCGQDAYDKIRAGASLVQLYSALTFQGPSLITKIKMELGELLAQDGFETLREAVGFSFVDH